MDPDANRSEQIEIAKRIQALSEEDWCSESSIAIRDGEIIRHAKRLAELALELFEWQEGRAS